MILNQGVPYWGQYPKEVIIFVDIRDCVSILNTFDLEVIVQTSHIQVWMMLTIIGMV